MECPSVGVRTMSTARDNDGGQQGLNGVSLRRGADNEDGKGQQRGIAEGVCRMRKA